MFFCSIYRKWDLNIIMQAVAFSSLEEVYPDSQNFQDQEHEPDLDYYKISVNVNAPGLNILLSKLCGAVTVLGANLKHLRRKWRCPDGYLVVALHPVIILTQGGQALKQLICQEIARLGYPAVPTRPASRFLQCGQRPVPTLKLLEAIQASCRHIMLVSYGMKLPFDMADNIFDSRTISPITHPGHTYPPNEFDISFTVRSDHIYTVKLISQDGLETWNIFNPLDFRPHPTRKQGGNFKMQFDPVQDGVVSLDFYSPMHHWMLQMPGGKVKLPQNNRTGQDCLNNYARDIQVLSQNPQSLGGVRWEFRTSAPTLEDAMVIVLVEKRWKINEWSAGLFPPKVYRIQVDDYLNLLPQLLDAAKDELRRLGFSYSHNQLHSTTAEQKKVFGDLKLLFGEATYGGYQTPPTAQDAWWRLWRQGRARQPPQPAQVLPGALVPVGGPAVLPPAGAQAPPPLIPVGGPPVLPPAGPQAPPPLNPPAQQPGGQGRGQELPMDDVLNDYLIAVARLNRQGRTRRVSWIDVLPIFLQTYPGLWTKETLRHRFTYLKKIGRVPYNF